MAHGDEQLVGQLPRALGLDQLALGVGVNGWGAGPGPHLGGALGGQLALDARCGFLFGHPGLALSDAAGAFFGVDRLAVLGGGFVAALFGQGDQGADRGAVGAAAGLARFPDVARVAGVVVRALLAPGVPGIKGWLAEFFFEDEGHLHPGLAVIDAANE
jgi:hypothetical protein